MLHYRLPLALAAFLIGMVMIFLPSLGLAQVEVTPTSTLITEPVTPGPTVTTPIPTAMEATPVPSEAPTPEDIITPQNLQPLTTTVTLTATLLLTPTVTPTFGMFLPFIEYSTPAPPPETYLFCNTPGLGIPDNNTDGLSNQIVVDKPGVVVDLNVYLQIQHTWVGDLNAVLDHTGYSDRYALLDRPGVPASPQGCALNNIQAIFDDDALRPAENRCAYTAYGPAIGGIFQPEESLGVFNGQPATGSWWLNVFDLHPGDTGTLQAWCLEMTIAAELPVPTPTPTPIAVPASASLNIGGRPQALPLDCETRSAIDYAAYFGVGINEYDFFNHLPVSDDPDAGFVGDVRGSWGQVPPDAYGVHAGPIADLLTAYGVPSVARRPLHWDELQAEIAAKRPVIVWIVDTVSSGAPQYYTALSNHRSIVAHYEHTVIVRGYDQNNVYFLNGSTWDSRPIESFIDSWSAMNFMAVIRKP